MTDNDIDILSTELLSEFTKLGADYPYLTKMIMDMISIVSQQNGQLSAITGHLETLTKEVNKQHFIINDILSNLEEEMSTASPSEFGTSEQLDYLRSFRKMGKEELN